MRRQGVKEARQRPTKPEQGLAITVAIPLQTAKVPLGPLPPPSPQAFKPSSLQAFQNQSQCMPPVQRALIWTVSVSTNYEVRVAAQHCCCTAVPAAATAKAPQRPALYPFSVPSLHRVSPQGPHPIPSHPHYYQSPTGACSALTARTSAAAAPLAQDRIPPARQPNPARGCSAPVGGDMIEPRISV